MGYNNENAARYVFDIETAPLPEAVDYLEQPDPPANYKDPDKISAYLAAKHKENLDRCGLDVDLCRVVAIGLMNERMDVPMVIMGDDEAALLRVFWQTVAGSHLIGFNCLAFDLPVLFRRSLYLGVKAPSIGIDRFKHPDVTDLQMVLSFNGALKLRGLSFYARRFGVDVPDALTGADIAKAVAEQRWADVEAHVTADVQKTAGLAGKVGAFAVESLGVL
jgi:hypothetical protein